MNPTTAATEATTQAIDRYLADNPGNEPLNALGMTADGRIVRLAEQEEDQRPALRRVFERQLETLIPRKTTLIPEKINGVLRDCLNETILRADVQAIWWDRQIRNRLSALKTEYAAEFAAMNRLTTTGFNMLRQTQTAGAGVLNGKPWRCCFANVFKATHWLFKSNGKVGDAKKVFYMSNVIAHQFEYTTPRDARLLELPTIIEQCEIMNSQTIECLIQHKEDYNSDAFQKAFLETTVIGRSTKRVAQDLGLTIKSMTVFYKTKAVNRIDEPIDILQAAERFNVQFQVSPDLSVYRR